MTRNLIGVTVSSTSYRELLTDITCEALRNLGTYELSLQILALK